MQFGVDTHKATLAVAAIDELGRLVAEQEFANTVAGHAALLAWAGALSAERAFGVESSGSWGYALASTLIGAGERVVDVPTRLADRQRRHGRRAGKSDAIDAVAIARAAARHVDSLPLLQPTWVDRDLKLLLERWQRLRRQRTREANRLHAELGRIRPGYQSGVRSLRSAVALQRAARLLRGDTSVPARLARETLDELRRLDRQLAIARRELEQAVSASHTSLTAMRGLGAILAALILVESRHFDCRRGRDAFARYNGTAPVPAASGRTSGRVRLNRGGNRRLNYALHQMAITLIRCDPRSRGFLDKKVAAGKTWREAIRCLKRHLSDAVYSTLRSDQHLAAH